MNDWFHLPQALENPNFFLDFALSLQQGALPTWKWTPKRGFADARWPIEPQASSISDSRTSVPWFFLGLWINSPSLFGRNCDFFIWVCGWEPLSTICNGCEEDGKSGLGENENYHRICSTFRTQKESAFESVVLICQCSIEWQCQNPLFILRKGSSVTANLETISAKCRGASVTELILG